MGTTKLDRLWANAGTKTSPTVSKQNLGWVDNEQVPYEWLNWLQNRVEDPLQEIIEASNFRGPVSATTSEIDKLLGYNAGTADQFWHGVSGSINQYEGTAEDFVDICPGWDYVLSVPCVYAIDVLDNTQIWQLQRDPTDNTVSSTALSLGTTLSAGTEYPFSVCCDGPSIYIQTGDAADVCAVHSYDVSTGTLSENWSQAHAGQIDSTNYDRNNIIVASATRIATVHGGEATTLRVGLVDSSDGGNQLEGTGNATNGKEPTGALCSDGSSLYFVVKDNGGTEYSELCAAKISDLSAPTTPAAAFVTADGIAATGYASCEYDGTHVWYVKDDTDLIAYDIANDSYIQNTTTPGSFAKIIVRAIGDYSYLAFDGIAMNVVCSKADGVLVSRFAQRALLQPAGAGLALTMEGAENQPIADTGGAARDVGRMVYSGGFLWIIPTQAAEDVICTPLAGQIGSL